MFICDIKFKTETMNEEILDKIYAFTGSLIRNGQIIGRTYPIVFNGENYIGCFMIPEKDSLDMKYASKFVKESVAALNKVKIKYEYNVTGEDPDSKISCECDKIEYYVLYTNYISTESPVRCGTCFNPIPVYKLPENTCCILGWEEDYMTLDLHQMHCQSGERYAIRQMSRYDSNLSKRGIEICNTFFNETSIPMYYYLYHPKGNSKKPELSRKCPKCNGEWLLDRQLYNFIDFCCHKCRLLSNIAWDVY